MAFDTHVLIHQTLSLLNHRAVGLLSPWFFSSCHGPCGTGGVWTLRGWHSQEFFFWSASCFTNWRFATLLLQNCWLPWPNCLVIVAFLNISPLRFLGETLLFRWTVRGGIEISSSSSCCVLRPERILAGGFGLYNSWIICLSLLKRPLVFARPLPLFIASERKGEFLKVVL